MLTTPRSVVKSSTKDLSFPIFEITNQPTLRYLYLIGSEVRCNCMMLGAYKTPIAIRGTSGKVIIVYSSMDSDLEAFSHNPAHGSFAPLAFQPSAMTNCANQRFPSY